MYNRGNIDPRYLELHAHLGVLECSKPNIINHTLPMLQNMEGVTDLTELLIQIKIVSYFANPENHLKWHNISGTLFSPIPEAYYTLPGCYP